MLVSRHFVVRNNLRDCSILGIMLFGFNTILSFILSCIFVALFCDFDVQKSLLVGKSTYFFTSNNYQT